MYEGASRRRRRLARNVATIASVSAIGMVMQIGGAGGALADTGIGGGSVSIDMSEAQFALRDGRLSPEQYAAAAASGATVLARTQVITDIYIDPDTGELVHEYGAIPAAALGVRGVGIPVVGPFKKFIPEPFSPLDMVSVDATSITGGITGSSSSSGGGVGGSVDPGSVETGEIDAGDVDPNGIVTVDPAKAGSGGTDGSCNPNGEGMIQHEPLSINDQTQNYYIDYTLVPYEKPLAHTRPGGMPTYQIALCAFGNMKVINGNRLLREGMAVTAWDGDGDGSIKRRIGQAYDTHVQDGISSGEVNFSLDVGAASVGASIGTTAVGKNLGAMGMPGPMKERDAPSVWSLPNVVQAWWDHNSSPWVPWRNKGSRSPQATINEGLYEFTYDINSFWYGFQPYGEYRCTARDGCPYHIAI